MRNLLGAMEVRKGTNSIRRVYATFERLKRHLEEMRLMERWYTSKRRKDFTMKAAERRIREHQQDMLKTPEYHVQQLRRKEQQGLERVTERFLERLREPFLVRHLQVETITR